MLEPHSAYVYAAVERTIESIELQLPRVRDPVEHAHLRAPAAPERRDDVEAAVGVDVGQRHVHALRLLRGESEPASEQHAVDPVEYPDLRTEAPPGTGDDVRDAVAVD